MICRSKVPTGSLHFPAALIVFCLLLTVSARAQGSRTAASSQAAVRSAEQDLMSREWNLTHIPENVNKQFKKEQISLFAQVNEDFMNIQKVNNDLMRMVFVHSSIDYRAISEAIGEIRKRAVRLTQNLALPKPPEAEQVQTHRDIRNDEQLKASLLALDHSLMSFVKNPLFQKASVIDPTLALTASRDIEDVIQFSNSIKQDVKKLSAANNQK
jgi:hypothetical protein